MKIQVDPLTCITHQLKLRGGDFLTDAVAKKTKSTVSFDTVGGKTSGTIEISLHNDTLSEDNGKIKVTLNADEADPITYTVVSGDASSAEANILDNDAPSISISSSKDNGVVTEGESFTFTLRAHPAPDSAIIIGITAIQSVTGHLGTLTGPNSSAITLNSEGGAQVQIGTSGSTQVTVTSTNDTSNKRNGEISVSLDSVSSGSYSIPKNTDEQAVVVKVADAVAPKVSITSTQDGSHITEGENITFKLEADIIPLNSISVDLDITDGDLGHFKSVTPTEPVTFHNVEFVDVTLGTNNTTTAEHGEISVAFDSANISGYTTATDDSSISVRIKDSIKPVVSVAMTQTDGFVTEGGSFTFTLSAIPVPFAPISVDITAVDGGTNHLLSMVYADSSNVTKAADGSAEITIGTSGTTTITVVTLDDGSHQRHGVIDIALDTVSDPTTDYSVSTTTAQQAIQVKVKDKVTPVLSISSTSNNGKVSEGANFTFTLATTPVPISPIMVDINVSELVTTGHLGSLTDSASNSISVASDGAAEINIGTSGSTQITVATTNDATNQRHGEIKVALVDGTYTDYTVSTTAAEKAIQVKVEDLVVPIISISSTKHNSHITEGGDFTFSVEANIVPLTPISVKLEIEDGDLGHYNSITPTAPIAMDNVQSVSVTLSTHDTTAAEQGNINVSIDDTNISTYTASGTNDSITVGIKDTVKPVVSITSSSDNGKVSEGNNFSFTVSSTPAPIEPISIAINVAELVATGHLSSLTDSASNAITVASDGTASVQIETDGSTQITVATTNDSTNQRHGEIKVALVAGTYTDYVISNNTAMQSVQVKIEDLVAPVISISSTKHDSHITEGESFTFNVEANIIPLTAISVKLEIDDDDSGHYKSITPTSPIAMHNANSVQVTLATNNTSDEEHGQIEVSIDTSGVSTYSASANDAITVGIKDSVKPVVSISSTRNNKIVTEGGSFTFTLTADPAPFAPISVDITAVDMGTGHLGTLTGPDSSAIAVAADGSAQVEIGTTGEVEVMVAVIDDTTNIRHGEINVSLDDVTSTVYAIATDSDEEDDESPTEIDVKIKEKTAPVLSISVKDGEQSVTEGGSFKLRLESNIEPLTPISVVLDITDGNKGHFDTITPASPITMHEKDYVDIALLTENTERVEHGAIVATINAVNTTAYTALAMNDSVTVGVKDSTKPVISISSTKNNDRVKEGTDFTFRLTAVPAPFAPIMVDILAEQTVTGHLGTSFTGPDSSSISVASDGSAQVEIGKNGTMDVTVSVVNDTTNQRHGEIDISLKEINNAVYEVHADSIKKAIAVTVEDAKAPIISISSNKNDDHITEGESFAFRLSANIVPLTPISVDLDIEDEHGHFDEITPSKPVQMNKDNPTVSVVLSTNDTTTPVHGEIEVSITGSGSTYTASDIDSITVGIKDTVEPKVSISIEPDDNIISEGDNFTFSLTASPAPFEPITVDITTIDVNDTEHLGSLKDSDDNIISIDTEDGSAQVEIGTGGFGEFTLDTNNDTDNKQHGEITVSLNSVTNEADYRVTTITSQQAVQVEIEDLVEPEISITSTKDGNSITEGESFIFRLESDLNLLTPISVNLATSDSAGTLGDFYQIVGQENKPITMHNVDAVDVTFDSEVIAGIEHHQITISINDEGQSAYTADDEQDTITVKIRDSVKPAVSIESSNNNGVISEGGEFTFTLTANPAPIEPIQVDLTAIDLGSEHIGEITYSDSTLITRDEEDGSIQVTIGTTGPVSVTVSTINDTTNKRNGQIEISFKDLTAENKPYYMITADTDKQDIEIKIKDKIAPEISITSTKIGQSVTEGEEFTFRIESDIEALTPIFVALDISSDSGHFNQATPATPIELNNVDHKEITLTTINTEAVAHGEISIAIDASADSSYTISTSKPSLSVRIRDSVIPIVSITSTSNEGVVTEGEKFEFIISAVPAPIEPISVEFTAVDVDLTNHLGNLSSSSPVEIGTDGSAKITVSTNLDDQLFGHGKIRVTLEEVTNADYKLAAEEGSKLIEVHVRDIVDPVVSITSVSNGRSVTEGGEFDFTLSVSPAPVVPIFVVLDIDDENAGYFRALTMSNPVELDGKSL